MSKNWDMLWQTAMLVMVVLFIFAAIGAAFFASDFALGQTVDAVAEDSEGFRGCDNLGQVPVPHFFPCTSWAWANKLGGR